MTRTALLGKGVFDVFRQGEEGVLYLESWIVIVPDAVVFHINV